MNKTEKILHDENELGIQFLLADFENLRGFIELSIEVGDKRIDVFISLTFAFIAGMGFLSQTIIEAVELLSITLIGSLCLLILGFITFQQVIDRDVQISDYIRAMNTIRRYFSEQAPQIKSHLLMPTSAKFPKYKWQSSTSRIPMFINSLLFGTCLTVILFLIRGEIAFDLFAIILSSISALITIIVQTIYSNRVFTKSEKMAKDDQSVALYKSNLDKR